MLNVAPGPFGCAQNPESTMNPYMTTSVLKRFAGFLPSEAFVG